jgi:ribosomal protein L44E
MARRRKKSRVGSSTTPRKTYRLPPWPKFWEAERGTCRFCGEEIIENGKPNRRKRWHKVCGDLWFLMNNPNAMRKHILKRDDYQCVECGNSDKNNIQADHKKPLIEANGDYQYYHPDNVRILCTDCHQKKTNSDMVRYKKIS